MLLAARHDNSRVYYRAERLSDAVVHLMGIVAALVAVPILINLAVALRGDVSAVASITLYGVALVTMLVFSALYHMTTRPRLRRVFRSLDHTAILCLIAATYTRSCSSPAQRLSGFWWAFGWPPSPAPLSAPSRRTA